MMACEYCTLDSAGMHALSRPPIARCGHCKYMRRKVTDEHSRHVDYARFWCDTCNGWKR